MSDVEMDRSKARSYLDLAMLDMESATVTSTDRPGLALRALAWAEYVKILDNEEMFSGIMDAVPGCDCGKPFGRHSPDCPEAG